MSHPNWVFLPQGTKSQPPKEFRNLKLFTIMQLLPSYPKKDIITDLSHMAFLLSCSKQGIQLAVLQIDKEVSRHYSHLETTQGS
jgi:hypothetical protein